MLQGAGGDTGALSYSPRRRVRVALLGQAIDGGVKQRSASRCPALGLRAATLLRSGRLGGHPAIIRTRRMACCCSLAPPRRMASTVLRGAPLASRYGPEHEPI